jgi:hypothetical protein
MKKELKSTLIFCSDSFDFYIPGGICICIAYRLLSGEGSETGDGWPLKRDGGMGLVDGSPARRPRNGS